MRILIVVDSYSLGGAESHALKFAIYCINRNIPVNFIVFRKGDLSCKSICEKEGIPTSIITEFIQFQGFPKNVLQINHYRKIIKSFQPNVIVSFNFRPNIWNGVISKYSKIRCSVWSQQSVFKQSWKFPMSKTAAKNVTCFVSNAQHVSDKLYNSISVKRDISDFHVVYNGIGEQIPKKNQDYWFNKLEKNKFNFIVTMVANITNTKDHETTIKAWKMVIDKKNDSCNPLLVLAGRKGEKTNDVYRLVEELKLENNIKFLGVESDIAGLNKHSNLGVLTSPEEGLPNAIMEQMASGLPVVGTDNDGMKEAVGNENVKYLSKHGDYEDLAEKIMMFINNPDLSKKVGEINKTRILNNFSIDKMGSETLKVIENYL